MRLLPTVLLALGGCAPLDAFVYWPRPLPAGAAADPYEDAAFTSADGTRLHGWFAEAQSPTAVVLYCHGNAGNVAGLRPLLRFYRAELGASVLAFDYRGYGRSEGTPGEAGVLADARAARAWLARRAGVAERDVVLVGRSLGGAVAVDLARDGARGLVLESTFTSMPDVADHHLWPLPARNLISTRLDSLSKVGSYRGPLLQSHGTADTLVPFAMAERLHAAANEPKRFVAVPGGGHNDPPTRDYLLALRDFVRDLPR